MAIKYKAAIIGCGRIAGGYQKNSKDKKVLTHAKAYTVHKNTHIAAAVDIDKNKLDAFCAEWGVASGYADARKMIKEIKPDIVSICTPAETHQDILKLCLDLGIKAIWCEKPIGDNYDFVRQLLVDKNTIFYVNHLRRWDRAVGKIKEIINNEDLGALLTMTLSCSKGFYESGSHLVDLICYLAGIPKNMKVINASTGENKKGNFFTADIFMEFECGTKGLVIFNGAMFNYVEFDFLFEKGRIKSFNNGFNYKIFPIAQSSRFPGHNWLSLKGENIRSDLDRSMLKLLDDIVQSLNRDCDYKNNLKHEIESFGLFCNVYKEAREFIKCLN